MSFLGKIFGRKSKVQFEPGDFAEKNAKLIEIQAPWLEIEKLWRSEAAEAENPERRQQFLELADLARRFHDAAVAVYSRWEILP